MRLYELKTVIVSPKNQVITGMPHGSGNAENAIEKYIIKAERLEQKRQHMNDYQEQQWKKAQKKMKYATEEEKRLLYLRCVCGLPWKKCVMMMNEVEGYRNWNINKAFRVYGKFSKIN